MSFDPLRPHTELFRDDLANSGSCAGAEIDLSGVYSHTPVRRDRKIGIDAVTFDRR